jgi:hypothetical protein
LAANYERKTTLSPQINELAGEYLFSEEKNDKTSQWAANMRYDISHVHYTDIASVCGYQGPECTAQQTKDESRTKLARVKASNNHLHARASILVQELAV